jgi:hypothetical protein
MAWLSPPCHSLDRSLWFPGDRAVPFFPLSKKWASWIISPPIAGQLQAARLASGLSAIIPTSSPPCASSSPDPCFANSVIAHSAAHDAYNTVVLVGCGMQTRSIAPLLYTSRQMTRSEFSIQPLIIACVILDIRKSTILSSLWLYPSKLSP